MELGIANLRVGAIKTEETLVHPGRLTPPQFSVDSKTTSDRKSQKQHAEDLRAELRHSRASRSPSGKEEWAGSVTKGTIERRQSAHPYSNYQTFLPESRIRKFSLLSG